MSGCTEHVYAVYTGAIREYQLQMAVRVIVMAKGRHRPGTCVLRTVHLKNTLGDRGMPEAGFSGFDRAGQLLLPRQSCALNLEGFPRTKVTAYVGK